MYAEVSELFRAMDLENYTGLQRKLLQELWFASWQLRKIYTEYCSEDFSDRLDTLLAYQTREIACKGAAKEIVAQFPNHIKSIKFNDDPRGSAIKLQLTSGRYNGFGGAEDGWCF